MLVGMTGEIRSTMQRLGGDRMKVLSASQMWSLQLLFQIGSNVVFGFASGAKQDAWIVAFLSGVIGLGLVWMYSKIYEWHIGLNWVSIQQAVIGKWLGSTVSLVYICALIYVAGRVLRDFGELTVTYLLPRTPLSLTMLLFLIVIGYGCYAGLERIARLAELCIPLVIFYLSLQFFFLLTTDLDIIDFHLVKPIASDWKRILTSIIPLGITVPFGETIAFAFFWHFSIPTKQYRLAALAATAGVTGLFVLLDLFAVSVLGPDMFARSLYPLITTFQMISFADFIENVDPLVVTNFLIGGFFKITIFIYAACTGISTVFQMKNHQAIVLPVCLIVWMLAIYMTPNISSHIFVGLQWVPWVMWVPLFIVIPFLIFVITGWKRKMQGGRIASHKGGETREQSGE